MSGFNVIWSFILQDSCSGNFETLSGVAGSFSLSFSFPREIGDVLQSGVNELFIWLSGGSKLLQLENSF